MELKLDLIAVNNHRQNGLANDPFAHFAESFFETVQGHNRFGHCSMTAGAADVVVEFFDDFAGFFFL